MRADSIMNSIEKCLECGLCSQECELLKELDTSPKQLAERGVGALEAFSCALCGACEAACPEGLSPKALFDNGRRLAVASGEMNLEEYGFLMPDHAYNLMRVYRDFYGIDYRDVEVKGSAGICFFPGCTLMTYAPELTRAVYSQLQASCGCGGIISGCCGKPLSMLGLPERAENLTDSLLARLRKHEVREVIAACPGCYYELRKLLDSADIKCKTVYEAMDVPKVGSANGRRVTVHDSCPDRFEGRFGSQVRELIQHQGFFLTEMVHNRTNTKCCGSGGMISRFRPDLMEQMVEERLDEAAAAGAEAMVSYCMSCVAKFADAPGDFVSRHALSIMLGRDDDFKGVRGKAAQMLEGPQGAELWAKMNSPKKQERGFAR